jgi:hypothetical protein
LRVAKIERPAELAQPAFLFSIEAHDYCDAYGCGQPRWQDKATIDNRDSQKTVPSPP